MMKYHYKVSYKFSKLFNTLWRIAIGFPILLSVLYYFLNYKMNSNFPFYIVVLASFFIVLVVFLIRFFGYKEIKASDVYSFYITDTKVISEYPSISKHPLSYEINISNIVKLIAHADSINQLPSKGIFRIKTTNGKTYGVSPNYVHPNKVFKIIRSLRPDLS